MSEIVFLVEDAPEGGFTARALDEAIFTEADDLANLSLRVREAVDVHFADDQRPKLIR
ncbi:MAG: 2-oxoisovalerate dehydrogenase, partial [Trueperaceae bacterium]